jgi:O-antigen/teichoic acid export membrane protein
MTDNEQQIEGEKSGSPLNKQMSPLAGGGFLGGLVFAFVLYRSHDVLGALLVGSVVFALIFWVIWAGQYLERRSKNKKEDD